MNLSEAREVVKKHPKKIGSFVREKLPAGAISRATAINHIRYNFDSCTGQTWRWGYSIGDGKVYGHKIMKAENGPSVYVPNLEIICAESYLPDENGEISLEIY